MNKKEILQSYSSEMIYHYAEMFRQCATLWRELYRGEVGEERYQALLKTMSGANIDEKNKDPRPDFR